MRLVMFALVSNQGTACSETAVCAGCVTDVVLDSLALRAGSDVDFSRGFIDCSENDALECSICRRDVEGNVQPLDIVGGD